MSYLHDLLSSCFEAQGLKDADRAATLAVEALMKVDLLHQNQLHRFELEAKVYQVRGDLTINATAVRFDISRAAVYRMLHDHARKRRAILRLIA